MTKDMRRAVRCTAELLPKFHPDRTLRASPRGKTRTSKTWTLYLKKDLKEKEKDRVLRMGPSLGLSLPYHLCSAATQRLACPNLHRLVKKLLSPWSRFTNTRTTTRCEVTNFFSRVAKSSSELLLLGHKTLVADRRRRAYELTARLGCC